MSVTFAPNAITRGVYTVVLMRGEHKVGSICGARPLHHTVRIADLHDLARSLAFLLRNCPQAEPGSRLRTLARGGSYVRTTR